MSVAMAIYAALEPFEHLLAMRSSIMAILAGWNIAVRVGMAEDTFKKSMPFVATRQFVAYLAMASTAIVNHVLDVQAMRWRVGILMTLRTVGETRAMVRVVAGLTVRKHISPLLPWPVSVKNLMTFHARDLMSATFVPNVCKNTIMTPATFESRHWFNFPEVNLRTLLLSNDLRQWKRAWKHNQNTTEHT